MEGGWETPPVSHQQPKELALPCLTEPAARHTRKKKEAKCLGKIPGMLQSHGDPLGLAVQELHGLGTAQAHTSRGGDGAGLGQHQRGLGKEPGCWRRTKQDPTVSLFGGRAGRFELLHGRIELMGSSPETWGGGDRSCCVPLNLG